MSLHVLWWICVCSLLCLTGVSCVARVPPRPLLWGVVGVGGGVVRGCLLWLSLREKVVWARLLRVVRLRLLRVCPLVILVVLLLLVVLRLLLRS